MQQNQTNPKGFSNWFGKIIAIIILLMAVAVLTISLNDSQSVNNDASQGIY